MSRMASISLQSMTPYFLPSVAMLWLRSSTSILQELRLSQTERLRQMMLRKPTFLTSLLLVMSSLASLSSPQLLSRLVNSLLRDYSVAWQRRWTTLMFPQLFSHPSSMDLVDTAKKMLRLFTGLKISLPSTLASSHLSGPTTRAALKVTAMSRF